MGEEPAEQVRAAGDVVGDAGRGRRPDRGGQRRAPRRRRGRQAGQPAAAVISPSGTQ